MDREQARDIVKSYLGDYLSSKGINTRKSFNCLNPEHPDRHPSMSYDDKRNRCKCFSCGVSYDIFDLIGIDYGLSDYIDIFNKAYELYGIEIDKQQPATTQKAAEPKPAPKQEEKPSSDNMEYYKQKAAALSGSPAEEYLLKRGISEEVASKYWLGYDKEYKTFNFDQEGNRSFCTWRVLIIPTGKNSFIARNIDTPKEPKKRNRYRKNGSNTIFNIKALYNAIEPIFVVEGQLDALSIIEAGSEAIGLGGTSSKRQLIENLEKQPAVQPLILALDQDEEGQKIEEELAAELTALQISFYRHNPFGVAKDANEALLNNRDEFIKSLSDAKENAMIEYKKLEDEKEREIEEERKAYLQTSNAHFVDYMLSSIQEKKNPPAKTGFDNLDNALGGGLYPGLYFLGAISSLGKTTLSLQIADQIAESGRDCIIFSLEMGREELIAKSLSRITAEVSEKTYKSKNYAKTTRGILDGSRWQYYDKRERDIIKVAADIYKEYSDHIFIHEGIGDIGVTQIKEIVEKHISLTGNKPIVIIDYMQILAPYSDKTTDKQNTDKSMLELKRLSRDNDIPVIAISSLNRTSYGKNNGKISYDSYKESGGIEYGADVLMGLEFQKAGEDNYNDASERTKEERKVRLVILKNRNGTLCNGIEFKYNAKYNLYEEQGFEDLEENEETPFVDRKGAKERMNMFLKI